MTRRSDPRRIGLILIVLSTLALLALPLIRPVLVQLVERYLSADHQMTPNGVRMLTMAAILGLVMADGAGFTLFKLQDLAWREKMIQIFTGEPLTRATLKYPPKKVLLITTLAGLIIMLFRWIAYQSRLVYLLLFWKDRGPLDLMVPVSMFTSAVILGITARRLWRANGPPSVSRVLPVVYSLILLACVFYGGEEISWGQDFLRWETPELFSGNLESQTNLHNYLNPYFHYAYMALAVIPLVVLFSAWMESSRRWLWWKRTIFPHPALIGLGVLIAVMALVWTEEQEVLEEMVAIFLLFYSIRVFTCFRAREREGVLASPVVS